MALLANERGYLLMKAAASATVTAAVTAETGYTDVSDYLVSFMVSTSRTNAVIHTQGSAYGQPIPGNAVRNFELVLAELDDTYPVHTILSAIEGVGGRFNFVTQPDKASITSAGSTTPAAAAANPQTAGSGVINSISAWSPSQLSDGTAGRVVTVTGEIGTDYAVRTS